MFLFVVVIHDPVLEAVTEDIITLIINQLQGETEEKFCNMKIKSN